MFYKRGNAYKLGKLRRLIKQNTSKYSYDHASLPASHVSNNTTQFSGINLQSVYKRRNIRAALL